ncbi:hypothetical protein Hanom_Chr15g01406371 [Helianthus anomalus]
MGNSGTTAKAAADEDQTRSKSVDCRPVASFRQSLPILAADQPTRRTGSPFIQRAPLSHSSELVSRAFRHFLATFTFNPIHRLRALYAQSFRRTLPPPPGLTVAAGMELAGASSSSLFMIAHSTKELYKRHCPSSLTRYCWIGLSPIVQESPLPPPAGVRVVSQAQCG